MSISVVKIIIGFMLMCIHPSLAALFFIGDFILKMKDAYKNEEESKKEK